MENERNVATTISDAMARAEQYFESTNQILGVFSFTAGIGCLGLDNQSLYAWMSLIFNAMAWSASISSYKRQLKMLRDIG